MRIDSAEVSGDAQKSKWLVRIRTGDEVVRRHFGLPKDANEQTLLNAALKTVQEEGYEADPGVVTISRQASAS